jgi:hypothetical protein
VRLFRDSAKKAGQDPAKKISVMIRNSIRERRTADGLAEESPARQPDFTAGIDRAKTIVHDSRNGITPESGREQRKSGNG